MFRVFRSAFNSVESEASNFDSANSLEIEEQLLEAEINRTPDHHMTESSSSSVHGDVFSQDRDYHQNTDYDYNHNNGHEHHHRSRIELEYYRDYDPMVGYRIAITLGILILLFTVFVLYKTHCHAKKNRQLARKAQLSAQLANFESMNL